MFVGIYDTVGFNVWYSNTCDAFQKRCWAWRDMVRIARKNPTPKLNCWFCPHRAEHDVSASLASPSWSSFSHDEMGCRQSWRTWLWNLCGGFVVWEGRLYEKFGFIQTDLIWMRRDDPEPDEEWKRLEETYPFTAAWLWRPKLGISVGEKVWTAHICSLVTIFLKIPFHMNSKNLKNLSILGIANIIFRAGTSKSTTSVGLTTFIPSGITAWFSFTRPRMLLKFRPWSMVLKSGHGWLWCLTPYIWH